MANFPERFIMTKKGKKPSAPTTPTKFNGTVHFNFRWSEVIPRSVLPDWNAFAMGSDGKPYLCYQDEQSLKLESKVLRFKPCTIREAIKWTLTGYDCMQEATGWPYSLLKLIHERAESGSKI
jgi:hypothetical protein